MSRSSSPVISLCRAQRSRNSYRASKVASRCSSSRSASMLPSGPYRLSCRAGPRHRDSAWCRRSPARCGSPAAADRLCAQSRSKCWTSVVARPRLSRYPAGRVVILACLSSPWTRSVVGGGPGSSRRRRATWACSAFGAFAGARCPTALPRACPCTAVHRRARRTRTAGPAVWSPRVRHWCPWARRGCPPAPAAGTPPPQPAPHRGSPLPARSAAPLLSPRRWRGPGGSSQDPGCGRGGEAEGVAQVPGDLCGQCGGVVLEVEVAAVEQVQAEEVPGPGGPAGEPLGR